MKKTLLVFTFSLIAVLGFSQSNYNSTYVNGYYKTDGTYVNGYYKTTNNNTVLDNYNYSGNYNPYNGSTGTKTYSDSYYTDKVLYTGPRGGQYYINSNGNKTYVQKKNW